MGVIRMQKVSSMGRKFTGEFLWITHVAKISWV